MKVFLSLAEPRAFLQNLDIDRTRDEPERIVGEEDSWDLDGMVTAEEAVTTGIRGRLRDVPSVCEEGGETGLTTIVDVIDLA